MTKQKPSALVTLPLPAPLATMMNRTGVCARILLTHTDGSAPHAEDIEEAKFALSIWAKRERRVMDLVLRAEKLIPANRVIDPKLFTLAIKELTATKAALAEAQAKLAAQGESAPKPSTAAPSKPSTARKPTTKPRKRAAAKRP